MRRGWVAEISCQHPMSLPVSSLSDTDRVRFVEGLGIITDVCHCRLRSPVILYYLIPHLTGGGAGCREARTAHSHEARRHRRSAVSSSLGSTIFHCPSKYPVILYEPTPFGDKIVFDTSPFMFHHLKKKSIFKAHLGVSSHLSSWL